MAGGAALQDELQGLDARFRLMFERSADAILLLDPRANLFVEYNQAALEMLRCTREELSALHPSVLSPQRQPDGRLSFEKAEEQIATALLGGSHRFEWVHRSPHRDDFPVEVLLTALPLPEGPLVVVVWRDITDRKRSEEALRQAQKAESLGVLAGGIAHDFNNLLTAMIGHLELARQRLDLAHPAVPSLGHVEIAVQRASDLTRQMLAYSGRGSLAVEPVDLGALVTDMVDLLRITVSRRTRLVCELSGGLKAIAADRAQAQQLVMNLVTNAAEAVGDRKGLITVRLRNSTLDEEQLQRDFAEQGLRPGPVVELEVEDTGCGMTPEVRARIFDPFFSTKKPGRGLGLAALLGILRSHGAGIRLTSTPGAGTTFRLYFPAIEAVGSRPVTPGPMLVRSASGTVLLVDDQENVRLSVRCLLEELGFSVVEASDGPEAIELFRAGAGKFSWVLMDLTMPQLDGYSAFLELRKLDPGVKVLLSSGWAEQELSARFAAAPPSAFLAKPYTPGELQAALARLGIPFTRLDALP